MQPSVRDNVLVSYEVQCEARRITLHTERRGAGPPESTDVVFGEVEGYHFADDAFGNVLSEVLTVPVEEVLARHGAEIADSFRRAGAPGPWAARLDLAASALAEKGVQGFVVSSSVGLTGWVLARHAGIVPAPKAIDAPAGPDTTGIYSLAADGTPTRLQGSAVVVAFGDGRELLLELSSPVTPSGGVHLRSNFTGPGGDAGSWRAGGPAPENYTSIAIYPGAANCMRVGVEARRREGGEIVEGTSDAPAPASKRTYFLVTGDARVPVDVPGLLIDLGRGRALQVDTVWTGPAVHGQVHLMAGHPPTRADSERMRAGGPRIASTLAVRFGGCNTVGVMVSEPYAAQAIRTPPRRPKPG